MSSRMKQSSDSMIPTTCGDDTLPKRAADLVFVSAEDDTTRTKIKYSSNKKIQFKDSHLRKHRQDDFTLLAKQPYFISDSELEGKSDELQSNPDLHYGSVCYKKMMSTLAENIRLRQLLKDVTEVNRRWQKYNQDRQDYVQQLLSTIQNLEMELRHQPRNLGIENVKKHISLAARHSDSELLDPSGELAMLRKAHNFCIKENAALHKRNEEIRQNFKTLAHHHETLLNKVRDQGDEDKLLFQGIQLEKSYSERFQESHSEEKGAATDRVIPHLQSTIAPPNDIELLEKSYRISCNDSQERISTAFTTDTTQCPICDTSFKTTKYSEFLQHYEHCLNRTSAETIKHSNS